MQLLSAPFYGVVPSGVEFFTGTSAVSSLVPDTYHCAIAGQGFMLDLNQPFYRQYRRQLAQLIRTQADTGTTPGDHSMDPNSLWRASYEDWAKGAGQRYLDRTSANTQADPVGSLPNAFWRSKGIDALTTKWQISLLPDTTQIKTASGTNLQVLVVGTHIYVIDGQHAYFASSIGGAFTTVAGTPAATISSACTDGFNVWLACGPSGVYHTTEGATTAADQWVTTPIDAAAILGYCNGRLMLAATNKIYNITAATGSPLPAPLFTAGNPNMLYTGFAEGNGAIYAGAYAGNHSWIYGMTVTTDGSALGAPVIQGALPAGETISAVYGYLGFLIVGSSSGVRLCTTATSGAVTLGALIATPAAVKCLTGWGRWVWFGWTTFDATSSGVGKMDLQNQVISNVLPAYCSDLMVTSQSPVLSVASYQGQTLFALSATGFYGPSSTQLVASGQIDSGYIMYDLTDNKVACLLDVQQLGPTAMGSYLPYISVDAGAFNPLGGSIAGTSNFTGTYNVGPVPGQRFEVRLVLSRDAVVPTTGPVITRWTLRSYAAPARPVTWQLPLIINEETVNKSGDQQPFDPFAVLHRLEVFASTGQVVLYQEGNFSYPVFIQDIEFLPDYTMEIRADNYFNGIALVTLVGLPTLV